MPQPLEIVVNRRGGVPVREQLVTQLEMKILDGTLSHGPRTGGGFEVHAVLPVPPVHNPARDNGAGA